MLAFLTLLACSLSVSAPIPAGKVDEIAREVCSIGHPMGEYQQARLTGFQLGGATSNTPDRYVDMAIDYTVKKGEKHTMNVRFYVDSYDPCKVRTDVIGDDGPAPVLLDNAIASPKVGKMVCEALQDDDEDAANAPTRPGAPK